jgi:hypothetical protein
MGIPLLPVVTLHVAVARAIAVLLIDLTHMRLVALAIAVLSIDPRHIKLEVQQDVIEKTALISPRAAHSHRLQFDRPQVVESLDLFRVNRVLREQDRISRVNPVGLHDGVQGGAVRAKDHPALFGVPA